MVKKFNLSSRINLKFIFRKDMKQHKRNYNKTIIKLKNGTNNK